MFIKCVLLDVCLFILYSGCYTVCCRWTHCLVMAILVSVAVINWRFRSEASFMWKITTMNFSFLIQHFPYCIKNCFSHSSHSILFHFGRSSFQRNQGNRQDWNLRKLLSWTNVGRISIQYICLYSQCRENLSPIWQGVKVCGFIVHVVPNPLPFLVLKGKKKTSCFPPKYSRLYYRLCPPNALFQLPTE